MPNTIIANFDAGRIPDVSDEANFHADATYVFEHMASDIIPGINANLDWMNAALTDAETIVDQVGTLTQNLATAPTVSQSDPDFGDFDAGQAVIGGAITISGAWGNGPGGAASQTYTGVLHVLKRAFTAGAGLTQVFTTSGGRPIIYTRVGTGNPYVFSDWVASVYAATSDQAENLKDFLSVLSLPTADGAAGDLMVFNGAGDLVAGKGYDEFVYDHAVDGTATIIDFTDLGDYRIIEYDMSVAYGANGEVLLRVSNDNGLTFHTTGYNSGAQDGSGNQTTDGDCIRVSRPAQSAVFGSGRLFDFNDASAKTAGSGIASGGVDRVTVAGGRYNTAEANDAIRFVFANTTTSGKITVRGYR